MTPAEAWAEAALVADLLALDPAGLGGARLRGRPGPARDAWLARLAAAMPPGAPLRRLPAHASEERLLGGLDLAATLGAGRPVTRAGLLAEADRGIVVLAMAERASPAVVAQLGAVLDRGEVAVERDGASLRAPARLAVVALDEGEEAEEVCPGPLRERMAFDVAMDALRPVDLPPPDLAAARAALPRVAVGPALVEALCAAAAALGVASPRASLMALRCARAAAALAGREAAEEADAALAARLVLAHRATRRPGEPEAEETPPEEQQPPQPPEAPETPDAGETAELDLDALTELVIEATRARLPAGLLRAAAPPAGRAPAGGAVGPASRPALRGRPVGVRAGRPEGGARLDLVETLRAAAPWQPLRRGDASGGAIGAAGVLVRREDFRLRRFRRPAEALTVFAVDASGSAAAQRLAEVKGAVELLLAESYVRRDRVALVAFRGTAAALALGPTRALARARRALAGLPGGGGTPLAAGIDAAVTEALAARRRGWAPRIVLLTDGRGNVARDGAGGRTRAMAEARSAAEGARRLGLDALLIDASPRPNAEAAALAAAMGARYLALPRADAAALSAAIAARPPA